MKKTLGKKPIGDGVASRGKTGADAGHVKRASLDLGIGVRSNGRLDPKKLELFFKEISA